MLTEKAISEFKTLYSKEYGIQLTNDRALEYGNGLVKLIKAVYGGQLPDLKTIDNVKHQTQNKRVLNS